MTAAIQDREVDALFAAIEHGDVQHRAWLHERLVAFYATPSASPLLHERDRLEAQLADERAERIARDNAAIRGAAAQTVSRDASNPKGVA